jgi:hypothetical protein
MSENQWPPLHSGEPARYCIVVEGSLDPSWSGRLAEMQIATRQREDQKPVTMLRGQVRDQAALMGVLNSLYQMHMTILSVDCESCSDSSDHSSAGLKP